MTSAAGVRGTPLYPEEQLLRKEGGLVSVELAFAGPDEPPRVRLLEDNVLDALVDSVRQHVRAFRVPCMTPGAEPVRLHMVFSFTPNDGRRVMASAPRDAEEARRRQTLACLTRIAPGRVPEYPNAARMQGAQGNVLLQLRFTSPTEPPQVTVLAEPVHSLLRESAVRFVQGWRLPCLSGEALSFQQLFRFQMEGGARTILRDMNLRSFLDFSTHVPVPAYFDTRTMGCPFDLRVTYMRPHDLNKVRELQASVASRRPLVDWLAEFTLRLGARENTEALGSVFTLSVPCTVIDLPAAPK